MSQCVGKHNQSREPSVSSKTELQFLFRYLEPSHEPGGGVEDLGSAPSTYTEAHVTRL